MSSGTCAEEDVPFLPAVELVSVLQARQSKRKTPSLTSTRAQGTGQAAAGPEDTHPSQQPRRRAAACVAGAAVVPCCPASAQKRAVELTGTKAPKGYVALTVQQAEMLLSRASRGRDQSARPGRDWGPGLRGSVVAVFRVLRNPHTGPHGA